MASVNKWIGIGNLGHDPELRYTQNNIPVATFSIACNDRWTDRETGEVQERTEWVRCVAWGRLAEVCGQYLQKGKQVYIEGRLQTREYEDRQGIKRWTTEIVVREMQMLGQRSDGARPPHPAEDPNYQQPDLGRASDGPAAAGEGGHQAAAMTAPQAAPAPQPQQGELDGMPAPAIPEDDLPF